MHHNCLTHTAWAHGSSEAGTKRPPASMPHTADCLCSCTGAQQPHASERSTLPAAGLARAGELASVLELVERGAANVEGHPTDNRQEERRNDAEAVVACTCAAETSLASIVGRTHVKQGFPKLPLQAETHACMHAKSIGVRQASKRRSPRAPPQQASTLHPVKASQQAPGH